MKKFILFAVLLMAIIATSICAFASGEIILQGSCGESANFILYKDGTLNIYGSGEVVNNFANPAWNKEKSSITKVLISEGITKIGANAFESSSNITSVNFPSTLVEIGAFAFHDCTSLKKVYIPDQVNKIGGGTFMGCTSLTYAVLPKDLTTLSYSLFEGSGLKTIVFPEKLIEIEESVFKDCASLKSIAIPEGVTTIKKNTFNNSTKIESIYIPKSVTSIETSSFTGLSSKATIYYGGSKDDYSNITIALSVKSKIKSAKYVYDHSHTFAYETISPKCTRKGFTKNTCNCGLCYQTNNLPMAEHTYDVINFSLLTHDYICSECELECFDEACELIEGECQICHQHGGNLNDSIRYTVSEDGILTVFGNGKTNDYEKSNAPFNGNEEITEIIVCDGITYLGNYIFAGIKNLSKVSISSDVCEYGTTPFKDSDENLTYICFPNGLKNAPLNYWQERNIITNTVYSYTNNYWTFINVSILCICILSIVNLSILIIILIKKKDIKAK